MTVLLEDKMDHLNETTNLTTNSKTTANNCCQLKISTEEIKSLSSFFNTLIDTIPPKIYFNKNDDIIENIEINKKSKFEDSTLSKKAKNKRIKLDPNSQQKISDIASAFYEKKKNDGKVNELRKKLAKRIKDLRQSRGVVEDPTKPSNESVQSVVNANNKTNVQKQNGPKIFNKDGNLVFSKFDFASQVDIATEKELNKNKKKKESLKGLMVKVKKDEKKIAQLETTNVDAANRLKEKKLWKSALEKCEGNKVRDDPKLIEKTMKRKKKLKSKRASAWADRKKNVEKRIQHKQEKREKHIKERKQMKKDKKTKLLKKKGRILT